MMIGKHISILYFGLIVTLSIFNCQNNISLDNNNNITLTNSSAEEVNITFINETIANQSLSSTNETKLTPESKTNHHNNWQLNLASYDSKYDYCSCDLKPQFCDLNCCCDEDCDDQERKMFAYCETIKNSKQFDYYCFTEYPIYLNNTRKSQLINEPNSNLFCVLSDNVKSTKTYPDRKSVTTVQEYRKLISTSISLSTSIFSWSHPHEPQDEVTTSFTSGRYGFRYNDPIVATSLTARGVEMADILRLPSSLIQSGGFCDTLRPILYLKDTSYSCLRDIKDYQKECTTNPFLGATIYYDNIYISKMGSSKSTEPETRTYYQIEFNESSEKQSDKSTLVSTSSSSQFTTTTTINVTAIKQQQSTLTSSIPNCVYLNECITINWSAKSVSLTVPRLIRRSTPPPNIICQGVVETINYTFYYHPKDGIDLVELSLGFTQLTNNQPFRQTFNVVYKPNDNYMINKSLPDYQFSGNAGYIVGKPILFRNSSLTINSSTIGYYKIPLLSKSNGQCSSQPTIQEIVRFGSNYRTGCMLNTSRFLMENQMCQSIQREIMRLLDSLNRDLNYVAMFGNPNLTNQADWIPILVDDEPQIIQSDSIPRLTADERCPALVTGYSLDVYYALVGQESQSQAKIISVVKRYNKPIDFRLRCYSILCRFKSNHYLLELSISVNYIDLTSPIVTKFASPPILKFQLPSDFFYPFLTNSVKSSINNQSISLICIIIMIILHLQC
ncbi:tectonic-3-like [Panonychus citri]|uniref:tectonic-3-like n=1 Tax=Panonychus citri TaxID=50023 RepID=UPI0023072F11|nr:tectonic-3-like [Panonychus citri]